MIPAPSISGLLYGLPIETYHGSELGQAYVSKSGLMDLAKSPEIFYARHLDPNRPPRTPPTAPMVLGNMTHCAILEPDKFDERYAIAPKCDRRTRDGKADWAAFQSSLAPGQEAADPDMVIQAKAMAASMWRNEDLHGLLNEGDAEVSAFAVHEETGVAVRVRPDFVSPCGPNTCFLIDVKTAYDASPGAFARTVAKIGYDVQAAMYTDIFQQASGKEVLGFVFAAVEKEHPFAVAAYILDADAIETGRHKYRRLLRTYAECLKTNEWPGYTPFGKIQVLSLPAWALTEERALQIAEENHINSTESQA